MLVKEEGSKVNFIDSNDLFVGYDIYQDCCEHAGWFISDSRQNFSEWDDEEGLREHNLEGFVFVPGSEEQIDASEDRGLDDGGLVSFMLRNEEGKELFLHLFNCHNGYYGHGAITNINGEKEEFCL